jgi:hypothetical protein
MPCNGHLVRDIEKQFRDRNLRGISDTNAVRIKDRDWPEARPRERPLSPQSGQSNAGRDPFEFSPPAAN